MGTTWHYWASPTSLPDITWHHLRVGTGTKWALGNSYQGLGIHNRHQGAADITRHHQAAGTRGQQIPAGRGHHWAPVGSGHQVSLPGTGHPYQALLGINGQRAPLCTTRHCVTLLATGFQAPSGTTGKLCMSPFCFPSLEWLQRGEGLSKTDCSTPSGYATGAAPGLHSSRRGEISQAAQLTCRGS